MNEKEVIAEVICRIAELNNDIGIVEHNLKLVKYDYHKELLELKYSDEYSQIKTIKEKEERAKIETSPMELEIIDNEKRLQELKLEKEVLMLQLKYLYTPFIEVKQ